MKTDLLDITFMIPVRADSIIRMENLFASINYLRKHFNTHILVLEASNLDNGFLRKLLPKDVEYMFIEDRDFVFYRTKYLNIMSQRTSTPFLAIWDTDVIIEQNQITESLMALRGGVEISFPYNGVFLDTSETLREEFIRSRKFNTLKSNTCKMRCLYGEEMYGGAVFVNKKAYFMTGCENEKYYGWGPEDFDRFETWKKFRFKIHRSKGPLYHLTHPRGGNSIFRSNGQLANTQRELILTKDSSMEEIIRHRINKSSI